MTPERDEVQLQIVGVFEHYLEVGDEKQHTPMLLLKDSTDRELRLPVASCEGFAIHIALEEQIVHRPLTHDLALRLVEKLSATIDRVVIDDASEDDFHASIHLRAARGDFSLPARPGDAVALAIRAEVPIYATEGVLDRASQIDGDTL